MSNFLLGGRLGDAIHALYVAKNAPGSPHNIFITDDRSLHSDGFLLDLKKTWEELMPIMVRQSWCGSFKIYQDEECINLSLWRQIAYSASWTQILCNRFGGTPNGESWITIPKEKGWEDKIIMHCSTPEPRRGYHWNIAVEKYGTQSVFIGTDQEFQNFGYEVQHYKPRDLYDYFTVIASCKFFIGNQSSPLAMAHAMGVPRLAMLNEVDKLHYVGEERWHKNFYWMDKYNHYFEGLNY